MLIWKISEFKVGRAGIAPNTCIAPTVVPSV